MKNICLLMLCALPFTSCSQNPQKEAVSPPVTQTSSADVFTTLKFEFEGKPCLAVINKEYKDFKGKSDYSLSLFLMVNTLEKDSNGHPTAKESGLFHELQSQVMRELGESLAYCHTGTTTMNGYRDILLYIRPADQEKATTILNKIKAENQRFQSYTFETDPEWEAVASFYEAVPAKN